MKLMRCLFLAATVAIAIPTWGADDPIFSGPQVGEKLPGLLVDGVFADNEGKELDLIKRAEGKSMLIIFVHERTRPAFGLTNAMVRYALTREGLSSNVVFLAGDVTETVQWMQRIKNYFPPEATYTVSPDGVEGPGAFGLNRNVALTILVAEKGKVTANFALVQPSVQADGPKILKAIVSASGGGKVPSIEEIEGGRYGQQMRGRNMARSRDSAGSEQRDEKLGGLVRSVIKRDATDDEVKKAAEAVEAYVAENEKARTQLGQIASRVVNSGRIANYGTEAAQAKLKEWAKKFGPKETKKE